MKLFRIIRLFFPKNLRLIFKHIEKTLAHQTHTQVLESIMLQNNVVTFIEIGVNEGSNIIRLAKKFPDRNFVGIDPYYVDDSEITEPVYGIHKSIYDYNDYNKILEKISKYSNIRILKKSSLEAVSEFEDESIDMVFIDALHSYEDTLNDIVAWLPKVKNDGILCGHDYSLEWFGVVRAVEDSLGVNNIILKDSKVWLYVKKSF